MVMNVLLFTAQLSAGTACGGSCDSGSLVRKADRMASRKQSCGARGGEAGEGRGNTPSSTHPAARRQGFFFPSSARVQFAETLFSDALA